MVCPHPPPRAVSVVPIRNSSQRARAYEKRARERSRARWDRARIGTRVRTHTDTRTRLYANEVAMVSPTNRPSRAQEREPEPVGLESGTQDFNHIMLESRLWSISAPRPSLRATRGERLPFSTFGRGSLYSGLCHGDFIHVRACPCLSNTVSRPFKGR